MNPSIPDIAARTGLSEGAVRTLHDAIVRGRGLGAQFSHPELGGMGQWMRGGMTMVGDMFNTALAARVALACSLLSDGFDPATTPAANWWPSGIGEPGQSASQDGLDYAYFPSAQRLVVRQGGAVTQYDLTGLGFRGIGAQSGRLVVQTSAGPRTLDELPRA